MKKQLPLLLLIFFFVFAAPCFATRNISFTGDKSVLFGNETMTLTASTSGFTDGETIYIKGAFYQSGSSSYFGYTQKSSDWIKNGDATTNQRQINIGNWDGKLVIKSDFDDSDYKGEGDYQLKIGFYYITSGGNVSSVNWSTNSVTVAINNPDPTPTNIPTPVPTHTPTPTPKIPTPTPTMRPTPTSAVPSNETITSSDQNISPDSLTPTNNPSPTTAVLGVSSHPNIIAIIFFSVGGILFVTCGILLFRQYRLGRQDETNDNN